MVRTGHDNFTAKRSNAFGNAFIICSDNDPGKVTCHRGPFEYMLEDGFAGESGECFTWESRGSKSGGNDAQNTTLHDRSYHKKGACYTEAESCR